MNTESTNVFVIIATTDKNAADVLAAAFASARNMVEVWACLRYARRMTGFRTEYASWLDGAAFYDATDAGLGDPSDILDRNDDAFYAIQTQAQDYVG